MTIKPREHFPNVLQQNKSTIFEEKNEGVNEVVEMPDVQQELWKKQWHAAATLQGRENSGQCTRERQLDGGQVNEEKNLDDQGNDNLLILAHSAALMFESEDNSAGAHKNDQNHLGDKKSSECELNGTPVSADERNVKDGSCCEGKSPRLSQIRRQARLKNHSLAQQSIGEYTCDEHLQEKTTHLTQIRPQAWSKTKSHVLLQERVGECSNENLQGRSMRLSEIRRQARCKVMQDGIEENKHRHLGCHTYEENRTERVATEQRENVDSCQVVKGWCEQLQNSSNQSYLFGPLRQAFNGRLETTCHQFAGVKNYAGELKEQQRIARQLRAMRTKKLRGQLGTQHIGTSLKGQMHALERNQIRQTGLIDLQWLQHISMMPRDPNFVACQQELLGTSNWSKELREKNIAAGQWQWNAMANQPSGQIYETHHQQHGNIPTFQQCEAEPGWLSLMSDMQQNEHCRLAALQKGAQHIEGKRATKNLHQHLNSHVPNEEACELDNSTLKTDHADQQPANSSCHKVDVKAEDKTMRVKGRMRLSQLRREARLANAHFIAVRHARIPNRGAEERDEVVMPSCTNDNG